MLPSQQPAHELRSRYRLDLLTQFRDGAAVSWQGQDFDFTGVVFDGGDFYGAVFSDGRVSFYRAVFSGGEVSFRTAVASLCSATSVSSTTSNCAFPA